MRDSRYLQDHLDARPQLNLRRLGFTLLELLVVIAVLGVLFSLLLPAIQRVRETSRRSFCENNLKNVGLALLNYESSRGRFPVGASSYSPAGSTAPTAGVSWWVEILAQLEQPELYRQFERRSNHCGLAMVHIDNGRLVDNLTIESLLCPSSPLSHTRRVGQFELMMPSYVGISGATNHNGFIESRVNTCCQPRNDGQISAGGVLVPNQSIRLSEIKDGASNTIVVGETSDFARNDFGREVRVDGGHSFGWVMGTEISGTPPEYSAPYPAWNITTVRYPPNTRQYNLSGIYLDHGSNNPFISAHPGGANSLRVDGSLLFLGDAMDIIVLKQFATRDDGMTVK